MPAIPDSATEADALDNFDPGMSSKRSSGALGVALTSTPSHDERQRLPSQNPQRNSVIADSYENLLGSFDNGWSMNGGRSSVAAEDLLVSRRAGDRSSMRSVNGMANGGGGTPVYDDAGRRRTTYFEEQVKSGAVGSAGRDKVHRTSPIVAELKTNVIIKDEFTLVTDLSHHLAQRYTRPDSSVMIRIDHSACLALGGTFEPCYILNLQTVPSQMGPSTNKRNASLIQSFMSDILSVPAERGIVTFTPIPEENLAIGGRTMLAEMEKANTKPTPASGPSAKNGMSGADAARKNAYRKSMNEARSSSYLSSAGGAGESNTTSQDTTPTHSMLGDVASHTTPDGRPHTAGGGNSVQQVNGLRMNGISTENLVGKAARLPNGRPKTFDGSTSRSVQDDIKRSQEPMPHVSRQSTGGSLATLRANASSGQRNSKVDIKKIGAPTGMQKNALQGPGATHAVPKLSLTPASSRGNSSSAVPGRGEPRTKNTYLDNVSSLTKKGEVPPGSSSSGAVAAGKDEGDEDEDSRGEANTGRRRRSTMTATPKMPVGPPPVPADERKETKSTRSLKLGKRKSFLRGFMRRSTQA